MPEWQALHSQPQHTVFHWLQFHLYVPGRARLAKEQLEWTL